MNRQPRQVIDVAQALPPTVAAVLFQARAKARAKARAQAKAGPKPEARIKPYLRDEDTTWFVYNASIAEVERRARHRGRPVLHFAKGIEVLTAVGWCFFTRLDRLTIFCACKTSPEAVKKARARARDRANAPTRPRPRRRPDTPFTVSLVP